MNSLNTMFIPFILKIIEKEKKIRPMQLKTILTLAAMTQRCQKLAWHSQVGYVVLLNINILTACQHQTSSL